MLLSSRGLVMTTLPLATIHRMSRWACVAACLGLMMFCGGAAFAADDPLAETLEQTDAEFRAVKDGVATAKDKIAEVENNLGLAEEFLKQHPELAPAERERLLKSLGTARASLSKHAETLDKFGEYSGKVTDALDMVYEVDALRKAIVSDDLSVQLKTLGEAMKKYGGKVPLIGKALEAYGEVTTGLVDATDRLQKQIVEVRNQGMLGSGTYGGEKDPRYKQLVRQFGKEFAQSSTFAPTFPREVFRPVDKPRSVVLLWDEEEQAWYRLDGEVPIETVFHDVRTARDDRPTVVQLKHLGENYAQIKRREAMAAAFREYLRQAAAPGLSPRNEALQKAAGAGGVLMALQDAERFRARFVYDGKFRSGVLNVLDEMRIELVRQGASAKNSLAELDALVKRHGVQLSSQTATQTATATGSKPTTGGKTSTTTAEQLKPKDKQTGKLERRAIEFAGKGLKPRDPAAPVDPNEAKPIIPEDCTIEVAVGDAKSGATYVDTYQVLGNAVTAKRPPWISPEKNGPGYWDAEERYTYSFDGALQGNVISGTWTSEAASEGKRYKDESNSRLDQHAKGTVKHVERLRIVLFGDGTVTWETQTETEVRMKCLVGVFDADTGRTDLHRKTDWPKQTGSAVWQIRKRAPAPFDTPEVTK